MKFFIKIKDGKPFEHPIAEDNFRLAYPEIDINNLPSNFAEFKRVPPPALGVYEKNQTCSYEIVDGVYQDVWASEEISDEEKLARQNEIKKIFAETLNYSSWIFDEKTCTFYPPVTPPDDNQIYDWDEKNTQWVEKIAKE